MLNLTPPDAAMITVHHFPSFISIHQSINQDLCLVVVVRWCSRAKAENPGADICAISSRCHDPRNEQRQSRSPDQVFGDQTVGNCRVGPTLRGACHPCSENLQHGMYRTLYGKDYRSCRLCREAVPHLRRCLSKSLPKLGAIVAAHKPQSQFW